MNWRLESYPSYLTETPVVTGFSTPSIDSNATRQTKIETRFCDLFIDD
jgi:hypothetical protein